MPSTPQEQEQEQDARKRPRPAPTPTETTDGDERVPKRRKDGKPEDKVDAASSGNADGVGKAGGEDKTEGQVWLDDQVGKMEKLYKEVLVQAALMFQHQAFSKRLGLQGQSIPLHMMHRLEATWRTYEGLRRQTEWCMIQSGQQPLKSASSPVKPTSTMTALTTLVTSSTPPKAIDLPIPSHLSINIDGIGAQAAKPVPLEKDNMEALDKSPPVHVEVRRDPQAPASQTTTQSQSSVQIDQGPPQGQGQGPAQPQIPDVAAPQAPPIPQGQAQPGAGGDTSNTGDGNVDYSSLGLAELTALINGDSFDPLMGMPADPSGSAAPAGAGQAAASAPGIGQQASDSADGILASLGIGTSSTSEPNTNGNATTTQTSENQAQAQTQTQAQAQQPLSTSGQVQGQEVQGSQMQSQPQSQPQPQGVTGQQQPQVQPAAGTGMEFDFSQALSTTSGLDGDFSALEGLFPVEMSVGTGTGTGIGGTERLEQGQQGDDGANGLDDLFGDGEDQGISKVDGQADRDGAETARQAGMDGVASASAPAPGQQIQSQEASASAVAPVDNVSSETAAQPGQTQTQADLPTVNAGSSQAPSQASHLQSGQAALDVPQSTRPAPLPTTMTDQPFKPDQPQASTQDQIQSQVDQPITINPNDGAGADGDPNDNDMDNVNVNAGNDAFNDLGGIDMSDFNFSNAGMDMNMDGMDMDVDGMGMGMDMDMGMDLGGDEFERLMAQFQ